MFKDYYKFPLKPMKGLESVKVLTADNKMAFDWCQRIDEFDREFILKRLNGDSTPGGYKMEYDPISCIVSFLDFQNNRIPILHIRGWGYLTGIGGLNLSKDEAKAIQDEFGEYIVKMLNN